MINKSIDIIIFMYALTTSLLAGQYMIADPYGIELVNYQGRNLVDPLEASLQVQSINIASENIIDTNFNGTVNGNPFNKVVDFNQSMAYSVFQLLSIISGTYIFYILSFLGLPLIVASGFTLIYSILAIRSIVGWLRGF